MAPFILGTIIGSTVVFLYNRYKPVDKKTKQEIETRVNAALSKNVFKKPIEKAQDQDLVDFLRVTDHAAIEVCNELERREKNRRRCVPKSINKNVEPSNLDGEQTDTSL